MPEDHCAFGMYLYNGTVTTLEFEHESSTTVRESK